VILFEIPYFSINRMGYPRVSVFNHQSWVRTVQEIVDVAGISTCQGAREAKGAFTFICQGCEGPSLSGWFLYWWISSAIRRSKTP